MKPGQLSIRAASWIGAQCLRKFCREHLVSDPRIFEFCDSIEEVATTEDLPAWERRGAKLEVSGLGDPLPSDLEAITGLQALVQSVHEIAASQMYAAWRPAQVERFLGEAIRLSGLDLARDVNLQALGGHDPGREGWGQPVTTDILATWSAAPLESPSEL